MGTQQQFCLKWNNHHTNMLTVFESLLSSEALVDVTLACEGSTLKAHKVVLSACSPFFQSIFIENPCQHPIVILKDMRYAELKAIVDFMYRGEVNVSQDQLSTLLKTAETLKVKGLAEVTNQDASNMDSHPPPSEGPHNPGSSQLSPDFPQHSRRKRGRPRKRSRSGSNKSDDEPMSNRIKDPSPDIEELHEGEIEDEVERIKRSNNFYTHSHHESTEKSGLPTVPASLNSIDEPHSGDDDYEVEPTRLMEQTLTTDNVSVYSNNSTSHSSPMVPNSKALSLPPGTSCLSTDPTSNVIDNQARGQSPQEINEDVKPRCLVTYDDSPISSASISMGELNPPGRVYMDPMAVTVPAIAGPSSSYSPDNSGQQDPQGFHQRPRYPNNYMLTLPPEVKASLRACFTTQPGATQQGGGKDTFCHMCGRNFSTKGSLRRHQLLHKPLRGKFHCPCCPKAFSWPGDLQTHIRCFHPDVPKSQRKYKLHFRFKPSSNHPVTHQITSPQ